VPGETYYKRSFSPSARGGGPGLPEVRRDEFPGQFDDWPDIPKLYLLPSCVRGGGKMWSKRYSARLRRGRDRFDSTSVPAEPQSPNFPVPDSCGASGMPPLGHGEYSR
jgi:hypothetical protein